MSWLARLKKPESVPTRTPVNLVLGVYGGSGRGVSEKAVPVIDVAAPALKSQPSTQPPDLVQPPVPVLDKSDKPPKHTLMENADTWRELDRAYQAHHFKCPICKAAGLGYGLRCAAGAALWRAYSDASS